MQATANPGRHWHYMEMIFIWFICSSMNLVSMNLRRWLRHSKVRNKANKKAYLLVLLRTQIDRTSLQYRFENPESSRCFMRRVSGMTRPASVRNNACSMQYMLYLFGPLIFLSTYISIEQIATYSVSHVTWKVYSYFWTIAYKMMSLF